MVHNHNFQTNISQTNPRGGAHERMADFLHRTKTINSDEELSLDDEEEVEKEELHIKVSISSNVV